MKRPHFALPDIYGEPMSFYEILNKLGKLLNEETLDRKQSDDKLKHDIGTEASAREQADTTLQQNINAETSAREQADTTLQQNINAEKTELSELKGDIANSKKAIAELNDKKITKFYANSLGETTLNDSDNGKIQDILIFGKSVQDGTPTPDSPVEIQSVVNPVVTLSDGENSKTATLPYTLNAIPISSGGNVTIDGQQYIADYVDVENKKLVRCVGEVDLGTLNWESKELIQSGFFTSEVFSLAKGSCFTKIYSTQNYSGSWEKWEDYRISHNDGYRGGITGNAIYNSFIIKDTSLSGKIGTEVKQALSGINCYYELATPTETNLTDEEVQEFKELATYYPATNVMVTSDQLDGYTTFNYQISMANGWNYVKEQLGDTREYIYDMDLQSAEAYVNSEYAVTLTELEV